MSDIGQHEALLAEWRNEQTRHEALIQFRDNGGEYRLRMRTDNNDPIIGGLMDDLMRGRGYQQLLETAIRVSAERVDKARVKFMSAKSPTAYVGDF